jgi:hypothetical protein
VTYPCPACGAPASAASGCPSCGRGPDPDAAEVIRADAEIGALIAELATAQHRVRDLEIRLGQAWHRRHAAAARVRVGTAPEKGSTVQNVLFILGGLLLGAAAIVFAAVAWAQFGVTGRAVLLAAGTLVFLAVPPIALRRRLTATAETMAAVGLLLTLLCGYATWHANLFSTSSMSPASYAGSVFALTAAIALAYTRLAITPTAQPVPRRGLTAPRYAALIAFQPVLPLLVAPAHPGVAGWSLTFGALAALNFAAGRRLRPAYGFAAVASLIAFAPATGAAVRTLDAAGPVFHAAWQRTVPGPGWHLPAALALVAAALFVTVAPRLRPAALFAGATAVALSLPGGLHLPWWHAPIIDLVVVAAALFLAARHVAPALRSPAARVAALPAAGSPSAPAAAASAVTLGTRAAASQPAGVLIAFVSQLVTAALLSVHALAAGFGRPGVAAGVLTTIALLGAGLALRAKTVAPANAGLFTALTALPAIAWTTTVALDLSTAAQCRAVVVAAGVALILVPLSGALRPSPRPEGLAAETGSPVGELGRASGRRLGGPGGGGLAIGALVAAFPLVCTLLGVTVAAPRGTVLEAYTIGVSVLALAVGSITQRNHSGSWTTYGPSLILGLLPSLILVLIQDGHHLRRLLLGLAALAILLAGVRFRRRAPLVAGGGTLAVLALHEIALVWDLIPRWIPLAAAGVVLVLLAATLESRRRDLARFRHALGRMS